MNKNVSAHASTYTYRERKSAKSGEKESTMLYMNTNRETKCVAATEEKREASQD